MSKNLLRHAGLFEKKWNIIKEKNVLPHIKKGKEIITVGGIEVGKRRFHHRKNLIFLEDIDFQKIQVSCMISSGEKNDDYHKIKPLCIMPSETSAYVKDYDRKIKRMSFY